MVNRKKQPERRRQNDSYLQAGIPQLLSRDAGVRPYGVSGGELRPVFPGPVHDLRPDGFQLLHPLPDHFHAAALYPGAGDALTGRGTPQPHRPAAAHQPGLSVGHRAGQVLCHGSCVRTALRCGCGDDLHPLGTGRHGVGVDRKPCGAALLLFAGLCSHCIV